MSTVSRLLVPPPRSAVPPGWTAVDEPVRAGLPHRLVPTAGLELLLVVPTGLATAWRDAPDTAVVSAGVDGRTARPARRPGDPVPVGPPHAPARLVLLRDGVPAGALPLVAGARTLLPGTGSGPTLELLVRDWLIAAGSLRGPGDVGSRISLAWRRADRGSPTWTGPRRPGGPT